MLIVQPCPSPFDIEDPVSEQIRFLFAKALAHKLGRAMKRQNEISYWSAELDGIPLRLRIHQDETSYVTYDRNDMHNLSVRLNNFVREHVLPAVKEIEPKVIRQPHK